MRVDPWIRRLAAVFTCLALAFASPVAAGETQPGHVAGRGQEAEVSPVRTATWFASVVLPVGSRLDLSTGRILAKGETSTGLVVEVLAADVKVEDPMRGRSTLRLGGDLSVQLWRPGGVRPPATRIARPTPGSKPASGADSETDAMATSAAVGAEYVAFSKAESPSETTGGPERSNWAYLRVLDVAPKLLRVEIAIAAGTMERIVRDPVALTVDAEPAGHRLRWSSAEAARADGAERYAVERRSIAEERGDNDFGSAGPGDQSGGDAATAWIDLGTIAGTSFLDRDAPRGRIVEYSVVRVDERGAVVEGTLGAVARCVRTDTPWEWPLDVAIGARVDLVSGTVVGSDDFAHVEVGRGSPGSLALRPLDGTRFALNAKAARDPDARGWWLPPARDRRFVPARTGILVDGGELEFVLPGGVVGRLYADAGSGDRWTLRRQIGIDGQRLLPRPPDEPITVLVESAPPSPSGAGRDPHLVTVTFAPVTPESGVERGAVSLIVERELTYGRLDWATVAEYAPGQRQVEIAGLFQRSLDGLSQGGLSQGGLADGSLGSTAPIARMRVRQRIVFGPRSHASAPLEILRATADVGSRKALIDDAIALLGATEFQARTEARAVLRHLGDEARPALEAVVTGDLGPRGVIARSILESIERRDASGRGAARSLRRHALDLARTTPSIIDLDSANFETRLETWLGSVPSSLVTGGPEDRAHGLLVLVDRAERGVLRTGGEPGDIREDCDRALIWAGAVAAADDDQGVRWLARFLSELGARPSLASFEAEMPHFLMEPEGRPSAGTSGAAVDPLSLLSGGSWIELPASADELAWQLERRPELADLDLGPPLARLLYALRDAGAARPARSGAGDDRYFDYDARSAELVLRLVARAQFSTERRTLLDAAHAILPGVALDLAARREVSDRRLASPNARAVRRRTILLDAPDLELLDAALGGLAADGGSDGVDVLLPAGIYHNDDQPGMLLLDVRRSNLRIMPADPDAIVEIRAGVRVRAVQNVVIEGVRIRNDGGSALMLIEGAHVVALRTRLSGAGSTLHIQDSDLELVECVVDAADLAKPPQWCVRQLGTGRLFARATSFDGGTLFLSDEGRAWLDRCVLDAGPRTVVQAQRAGHLVARETLFRGENLGLYNVADGVLAAVVIDVPRDPLGRRPTKLRVSPRLFHLVGEGQAVPGPMKLPTEPLDRR